MDRPGRAMVAVQLRNHIMQGPILLSLAAHKDNSPVSRVGSSSLTCTRFQPWRDSAMIDVTDGQTPPNTIKWFGPYFIAS